MYLAFELKAAHIYFPLQIDHKQLAIICLVEPYNTTCPNVQMDGC